MSVSTGVALDKFIVANTSSIGDSVLYSLSSSCYLAWSHCYPYLLPSDRITLPERPEGPEGYSRRCWNLACESDGAWMPAFVSESFLPWAPDRDLICVSNARELWYQSRVIFMWQMKDLPLAGQTISSPVSTKQQYIMESIPTCFSTRASPHAAGVSIKIAPLFCEVCGIQLLFCIIMDHRTEGPARYPPTGEVSRQTEVLLGGVVAQQARELFSMAHQQTTASRLRKTLLPSIITFNYSSLPKHISKHTFFHCASYGTMKFAVFSALDAILPGLVDGAVRKVDR